MRPMGEHSRKSQHRAGLPTGTWSLAALSVAACLCSVLGAKLLSNMFDPAPQVEAPAPKGRRRADVDYVTTGTIPDRMKVSPALTPCGDAADH
jgi:hypothetical protein